MHSPEEILKRYWGFDHFRSQQAEIISSVLNGTDTLGLLPTGGGKSVCYQVPAIMQDGFCLVISPLIALMQDQVARLKTVGVPAACISAGMSYTDVKMVLQNMLHGPYKLLYISPERLQTNLFNEYLPEFNISFIAVDEAHCISQWGHDFRPDYLKIAALRQVFDVPVLAITATATDKVQADITNYLQLKNAATYKTSGARHNILYEIKYTENKNADTLQSLRKKECSIIYCRSRKQTELLAKYLQTNGVPAIAYHAGLAKDVRDAAQQSWMRDESHVIAATTAFGMGIDKPDVRTVLHYEAPEHLEAYYQEAGRAGRDGHPATALLLYNYGDIKKLQESTALKFPPETYLRKVYQAVAEYLQIPTGTQPKNYLPFDLAAYCKNFKLEAVPAANALKLIEQEGLWTMTESVFHPATVKFICDRYVIDELANHYPSLHYVCTTLLRMYSGIFQYPASIRISSISRQLKMNQEITEALLQQLQHLEIIEYNKPLNGPQILMHHTRVDSAHLIINMQRINALKAHHEERTKKMVYFLENTTICRERILLEYFGEVAESDCGHCDVCIRKKVRPMNRADIKNQVLQKLVIEKKMSVITLISTFDETAKSEVIAVIRELADKEILKMKDNELSID